MGTKQESSTKELVFTGTVTEQMMDELTENCVGSDECLKYFTIAFYTGNKLVFESAHYGYEIYWLHTGFAEMTSSFGKKRSGIFVFYVIFLPAERCPSHPFPVG